MKTLLSWSAVLLIGLSSSKAFSQNHPGNWIHRNMMDTTFAYCWNDSLTCIGFPPGSMSMMMPDSIYCRIEEMAMDSLIHPHDSTMIGWCRVQMGSDSMHFDLMNCDSSHGNHQMGFMRGLQCQLHWDSLWCDSTHWGWRPVGIKGWNGTDWVAISGVSFEGDDALFNVTTLYTAFGFIGEPATPLSVSEEGTVPANFVLQQNYPNPFNPTTTISFTLAMESPVNLQIVSALGQEVATLVSGQLTAGTYSVKWNAGSVSSGMYFYSLQTNAGVQTKKLVLLR
jgi:hypothetical protein